MKGNGALQETALLAAVIRRVRQQLPDTWSVQARPWSGNRSGWQSDAVLAVTSPGNRAEFDVEVKVRPWGPTAARSVATELRSAAERLRPDGMPRAVLLITDFASPALREACEQRGISYADETGWLHLRHDDAGVFVVRSGAARPPLSSRRESVMQRLDGPGASAVIRALWATSTPVGVRALADVARVSSGTSAKVLPALTHFGAVERGTRGEVISVDRRLLIDRWTQDYGIYSSNPKAGWFLSARGPAHAQKTMLQLREDDPDVRMAFTGYIPARRALPADIVPVIPDTLLSVYSPDPDGLAGALRLRPVDRNRANVVIVRPRDESLLAGTSNTVPTSQAIADLLTMGGRFPELAEQLLDYATEGAAADNLSPLGSSS